MVNLDYFVILNEDLKKEKQRTFLSKQIDRG